MKKRKEEVSSGLTDSKVLGSRREANARRMGEPRELSAELAKGVGKVVGLRDYKRAIWWTVGTVEGGRWSESAAQPRTHFWARKRQGRAPAARTNEQRRQAGRKRDSTGERTGPGPGL